MNYSVLPRYTQGYLDGMKKKRRPKFPFNLDYMSGFRMAKRDQKWMQKQEQPCDGQQTISSSAT